MNAASLPQFVFVVTLDEIQMKEDISSCLDVSKYFLHAFSASDTHHEPPNLFWKAEYTARLVWLHLEREEVQKESLHVC